jgi:hypothetical protein
MQGKATDCSQPSQTVTYKAHWNQLDKLNEKKRHVSQQKLGDKTNTWKQQLHSRVTERKICV